METDNRPLDCGVWWPSEIYADTRLDPVNKMIVVEIARLNSIGKTDINNKSLARKMMVGEDNISKRIQHLKKAGWVDVSYADGHCRKLISRMWKILYENRKDNWSSYPVDGKEVKSELNIGNSDIQNLPKSELNIGNSDIQTKNGTFENPLKIPPRIKEKINVVDKKEKFNNVPSGQNTDTDHPTRFPQWLHRFPVPFRNHSKFAEAWTDWEKFRSQKKLRIVSLTANKHLNLLTRYSPEIAVRMIEQSIDHGWTGLFVLHHSNPKAEKPPVELPKGGSFLSLCDVYAEIGGRLDEDTKQVLAQHWYAIRDYYRHMLPAVQEQYYNDISNKNIGPGLFVNRYCEYIEDNFQKTTGSVNHPNIIGYGSMAWKNFIHYEQHTRLLINFATGRSL